MKLSLDPARADGNLNLVFMRAILALVLALLVGAVSVGNAVVRAMADSNPRVVGQIWPGHPLSLRAVAMAEVGEAAATGRLPSPNTLEKTELLSARAPLAPEPFLINAALAAKAKKAVRAEQLLLQARRREPRSLAARYLLADLYLREGRIVPGLREILALSRFISGASAQLLPGLAAYARTPDAVPKLKAVLRENPDLEPVLLSSLATDPDNTDLVLALASDTSRKAGLPPQDWQVTLLSKLVEAGKYNEARATWARLAGINPNSAGLFRPDFSPSDAPPPFNWTLASTGSGTAEPADGGGLNVLYYGRDDAVLATQLILLPTGLYQLAVPLGRNSGATGQLRWTVKCLPSGKSVLELPIAASKSRMIGGRFRIPATGCSAQLVELKGVGQDTPKSSDVYIASLRLTRVSAR